MSRMDYYRIECDAHGCDHITDNDLRRERLDIMLVSYGLEYLFLTCLTSFKSRHVKLSFKYIYNVWVSSILSFHLVHFMPRFH